MTSFDRDNMGLIFTALTNWWLKKWSYGQNITRLARPLVAATLDVYEQVRVGRGQSAAYLMDGRVLVLAAAGQGSGHARSAWH